MKNYKKLLLGLGLFMAFGLGLFFVMGGKSYAYTAAQMQSATFSPIVQSNRVVGFNVGVGGDTVVFSDQDPFDINDNAKASGANANQFCANTRLGASGSKGITYTNDSGTILQTGGIPVSVDIDYTVPGGGCGTFTKNFIISSNTIGGNIAVAGANCPPPQSGQTNGNLTCTCRTSGSSSTPGCKWVAGATADGEGAGLSGCMANSGRNALGWIICPILDIIDNTVDKLYQGVQNRLCFPTSNNPGSATAGNASSTCNLTLRDGRVVQKSTLLTPETKKAWSSFRAIATSLLVIAMLYGIIGQAIGTGRSS